MRLLEEMTWADKGKEGTEAGVASFDHILRGLKFKWAICHISCKYRVFFGLNLAPLLEEM